MNDYFSMGVVLFAADSFVNASEFVSHFTKTGMSVKGSLYVFFRSDANSDSKIDAAEVTGLFNSFDASSKCIALTYFFWCCRICLLA